MAVAVLAELSRKLGAVCFHLGKHDAVFGRRSLVRERKSLREGRNLVYYKTQGKASACVESWMLEVKHVGPDSSKARDDHESIP